MNSGLVREFEKLLGPSSVLCRPEDLLLYEYDGSVEKGRPDLVVFPNSTEDVSRIAKLAAKYNVPIVGRGAGTGLFGGALARPGGVMLVFARMNRILELGIENQRAVVQPGVVNYKLTRAAEPHGIYFAHDPSSWKSCTIGGNVAENAGGPHTLAYGVTTNHVTALELVLPDGEIVRVGSKHGDAPGYDLTGLFVGSEGTLALITEITVRLSRKPEAVKTLLAIFDSVDDAADTVVDITARAITPAACEMLDGWTLRAVEDYIQAGFPMDSAAVLLIEVEGLTETVAAQAAAVAEVCNAHHAREVRVARDNAERNLLWKGRKNAFGALGRLPPAIMSLTASFRVRNFRKRCATSGKSAIDTAFRSAKSFTPGTATCTPSCSTIRKTPRNSSAPSKPPSKSSAIASRPRRLQSRRLPQSRQNFPPQQRLRRSPQRESLYAPSHRRLVSTARMVALRRLCRRSRSPRSLHARPHPVCRRIPRNLYRNPRRRHASLHVGPPPRNSFPAP